MKQTLTRGLALCLCAAFLFGCLSSIGYAVGSPAQTAPAEAEAPAAAAAPAAREETKASTSETPFKDETVYVMTAPDGSVEKVIVSDWLKNAHGLDQLPDVTRINDPENVKGDGAFTPGADGAGVWDAAGGDVYYQGSLDQPLPVSLSVSYKLDGKPISAEALEGQSGRVTIRFDYHNDCRQTVEINGKPEQICVPFTMITGLLLDNETFSNVEVSNGRTFNDGARTVVAGVAFPGLQEDLGLDAETLALPDCVEVSADAVEFSLGMTVTVASNELFSELDESKLDSADGLTDALGELTDAMDRLLNGSDELYNGLCTLLDSSNRLADGVDRLADGAQALNAGAGELSSGVSALQGGAAQLSAGLDRLDANSGALNSGACQVFTTLLATAGEQLNAAGVPVPAMTPANYASVLNGVIASLDETAVYQQAEQTVTAAVEAQREAIRQQVAAAVRQEVEAGVTAAARQQTEARVLEAVRARITPQVEAAVRQTVTEQVIQTATGMDAADYDAAVAAGLVDEQTQAAVQAALDAQLASDDVAQATAANVEAQMNAPEVQQTVAANVEAQMSSDTVQAMIAENVETKLASQEIRALIDQNTEAQVRKAIADTMAGPEVQAKLAAASEGAQSVIALKTSLDSYNAFYLGLQSYTAGVAEAAAGAHTLADGADRLKAGTGKLAAGAGELSAGLQTLKGSTPALVDGVTKLRDGSRQLSDGLHAFNDQGVQKLADAVDGDLETLLARVRAVAEVSRGYRNYSGIAEGTDGQVKFVFRTGEIGG